jgi:hypothetical protein
VEGGEQDAGNISLAKIGTWRIKMITERLNITTVNHYATRVKTARTYIVIFSLETKMLWRKKGIVLLEGQLSNLLDLQMKGCTAFRLINGYSVFSIYCTSFRQWKS